jgi:hypothetical protein
MSVPPCPYDDVRIPCESCNRQFRIRACFDNHKTNKIGKKTVCEKKRYCAVCSKLITERDMNVSNRSVRFVSRTERLVISVLFNRLRTNCLAVIMSCLCFTILKSRRIQSFQRMSPSIFQI